MNQETLAKLQLAENLSAHLMRKLDMLSTRLSDVGMDKLAQEVFGYADTAEKISQLVAEGSCEAVGEYFLQSIEGTNNMVRGIVAVLGGNPDEIFTVRKDS